MLGYLTHFTIGTLTALLMAGSALAAPEVVVLGAGGDTDPLVQCGDLAASPFEAGRNGRGVNDEQIFIDGAITACEAALGANPESSEAMTWLARAYVLAGRRDLARPLLETATEAGNPFAAFLLSNLVGKQLDGVAAEDEDRAIDLIAASSDGGFAPAQSAAAERLERGGGVPGNYEKARDLYQLAADQNFAFAYYKLGQFAEYGLVDAADIDLAIELYQRAADAGEPLGYYGLAYLYEVGQGVAQDYARAVEYYQAGADAGEKMSQTALAYLYEQGLGVTQDYDKSFELLVDAAGQGWGFAQAALSIHYLFGQGTPVDEEKAFGLAMMAEQGGVVYARGILGYMYQNGLGTVRSLSTAKFQYESGANGGDQYSADQIPIVEAELACQDAAGSPHEPGGIGYGRAFLDIDPDAAIAACENAMSVNSFPVGNKVWLGRAYARAERFQDAVPLLEEGVAAGNVLAHVTLGDLLMTGSGTERDPQRAIALYEAVSKDFGPAQYTLGLLYSEGHEVPQDRNEALRWLRLAESFGVEEAAAEIAALLAEPDTNGVDLTGFGREGPGY